MINLLVTVGVFKSRSEIERIVRMSLPCLPRVGDIIIPNSDLQNLMNERIKEWGLLPDVAVNFVRAIAFENNLELPIVMLGGDPKLITVDISYNNKIIGGYLRTLPKIGDSFFVENFSQDESLYVSEINFDISSSIVVIFLTDEQPTSQTYVTNSSFNVEVMNTVDVGIMNTVDVEVINTVDVEILRSLNTIDVNVR